MKESNALPTALRDLLIEVRSGLREKGDLGAQGDAGASVNVTMGWPEIRAVYALHKALVTAREARDTWKAKALKAVDAHVKTVNQTRADLTQLDLLNDRAILKLFGDIEKILSNDPDVTEMQLHETRKRVGALLGRAGRAGHSRRR